MDIVNNFVGYYGQSINMETAHNYFSKIKPIDKPIFKNNIPSFCNKKDLCLSYSDGKNIKIYPIKVMNERRIIHDYLYDGDKSIQVSITYCPLTGSPVVYEGLWGFSGMLYNNNDVLYNTENNEDLIVQIIGTVVYGNKLGKCPPKWQMIITSLENIMNEQSLILQGELGDEISYENDTYALYKQIDRIDYPINKYSNKYHQKKIVYALDTIPMATQSNNNSFQQARLPSILVISKKYKNKRISKNTKINFNDNTNSYILNNNDSFIIPMYWFASYAMYKNPSIIQV